MLSTDAVEVLAARIDVSAAELDRLAGILHPRELQKARGMQVAPRRQFVATRALLRRLLGERLGVAPSEVPIRATNGKLSVAGDVLFNVAHSKDLAVFAFTQNRRVGVDVEWLRPVTRLPSVVELAFTPAEAAELGAVPAGERVAAFFAGWTRKEAYVKATAAGLGAARSVTVSPEPAGWELTSFEPRPGYVGAVAVERAA